MVFPPFLFLFHRSLGWALNSLPRVSLLSVNPTLKFKKQNKVWRNHHPQSMTSEQLLSNLGRLSFESQGINLCFSPKQNHNKSSVRSAPDFKVPYIDLMEQRTGLVALWECQQDVVHCEQLWRNPHCWPISVSYGQYLSVSWGTLFLKMHPYFFPSRGISDLP